MINGNFTITRTIADSNCSKIYMTFEGEETYDECKKFALASKKMGAAIEVLEHPNKRSLLIVVPTKVAEYYEKSIIEYATVLMNAMNKALGVYRDEIKKHLDKKLGELKEMDN